MFEVLITRNELLGIRKCKGQRYDGHNSMILVKNRYLDDFSPHLGDISVEFILYKK